VSGVLKGLRVSEDAAFGPNYPGRVAKLRIGLTPKEWLTIGGMVLTIVALNILGWGLVSAAATHHYHISKTGLLGLGTGLLAYTLGMRHAFDADHIAAIDNTTRKLVNDGKRPLSVGYYFSLGHSTVVFLLALFLNLGIRAFDTQVSNESSGLHQTTSVIGTAVSGGFLYLIGILNLVVLFGIFKVYQQMKRGRYDNEELERQLNNRGLINRLLGGYGKRIDAPWKMYPLGILFGLGFDTATEVALLVLAGNAVAGGLPFWAIISLPVLFAAGMCLFDTIDGCFMNFAYDWAFSKPIRKVFYNLTITGLSVFVALFIGTIELVALLGQELGINGPFFNFFSDFNINTAGFVIVGIFAATWATAVLWWHFGNVEEKWDAKMIHHGRDVMDGLQLATNADADPHV
jgi:nickel/cobalt transporter (NiCoT) family protein